MSSRRGNAKKSQKHQNTMAYRNDMHDTSRKTKALNQMVVGGVCSRCKEQIEWKIKYGKYKHLSQPKKCVKCEQKTVTQSYHIMCKPCATAANVCAKCSKKEEIVGEQGLSPAEEAAKASELESELRHLPERQRRTFFRGQAKGCTEKGDGTRQSSSSCPKDKEYDDDDSDRDQSENENNSGDKLDERTS